MNLTRLPKVELHIHLDCSLSFEVVQAIDPSIDYETYHRSFVVPPKCPDLTSYLEVAVRGATLMQTKAHLQLVTQDLFRQLQADNVIYAELRFAPLQHLAQGLRPEEVVATVADAVEVGREATGIEAGIILCTMRSYSEAQSMNTVRLVETFQDQHVVGFDIAGDEAGFPLDNHVKAFTYARERGIPRTAHAGEACGPAGIWQTLEQLQVGRLGHGVRSAADPDLVKHLRHKGIHLELCPTSNVRTHAVPDYASHPIDGLYRQGVSLSINTDGRNLLDLTLSKEYQRLEDHFDWQKEHYLKCNLEAIKHAFASEEVKKQIRNRILNAYVQ